MIKALPVRYNGILYRSRTEARWAVFFDEIGVRFEYERQGYNLPSWNYPPDFTLFDDHSDIIAFAKVKGRAFLEDERRKCYDLACLTTTPVLLLDGCPDFRSFEMINSGDSFICEAQFIIVSNEFRTYGSRLYRKIFYLHPTDQDFEDLKYNPSRFLDYKTINAIHWAKTERFEWYD